MELVKSNKEEKLIDPMIMEESEEDIHDKRQIWNDIMDRNPEFAYFLINNYTQNGDEAIQAIFKAIHNYSIIHLLVNDAISVNLESIKDAESEDKADS